MFKFNPLTLAVVALTSASLANAGTIHIQATGYAQDQKTSVQGIAGYPPFPIGPTYTMPKLASEGTGPGWPANIQLALNDQTGAVKSFKVTLTGDQVFGSGGPQYDIRMAGRNYTSPEGIETSPFCQLAPGDLDAATIAGTQADGSPLLSNRPAVAAGGNGDGTTGKLTFHCGEGAPANSQFFNQLNARDGLCATPDATSLETGVNGCSQAWNGDLAGVSAPTQAPTAQVCLSDMWYLMSGGAAAGYKSHSMQSTDGVTASWSFDAGDGAGLVPLSNNTAFGVNNPTLYCSVDFYQNSVRRVEHEGRGGRAGGTITVNHTGSLAGGDFVATSIDYVQDTDIAFLNTEGGPAAAQSFSSYEFATIVEQSNSGTAKNVPAMGSFGLVALFGGLIAVAARLRRRVS